MRKLYEKLMAVALVMMAGMQNALAALPTVAAPSTAPAKGNYMELIQNYGLDLAILVGLGIATVAFVVVANNVISTYKDVQRDKKTWGDMGAQAVVGCLLLVGVVYLMNEAAGIMT